MSFTEAAVESLANLIANETLSQMTPDERVLFHEILFAEYCLHCGCENKDCPCMRDE